MTLLLDPIKLGEEIKRIVTRGEGKLQERKYYRFRGGRWYGGIATADCVGCNLKCKFCWSWRVRDNPHKMGEWETPKGVSFKLAEIASQRGYKYVRISGGEPTLSFDHLVEVINSLNELAPGLTFILETNGILLGYNENYVRSLSKLENLHVRVSIKGCSPEDFSLLTGAYPWGFELQLRALEYLARHNISAHPAAMVSFSDESACLWLRERLRLIDERYYDEFEEEYVFLYPHVREILRKHNLTPKVYYYPDNMLEELI